MLPFIDEAVVIDSSNPKDFASLRAGARKLKNVRLFHAIALGYAEPLRTYGISKCRNQWILLLDTDETPSEELKNNLKQIVDRADFDVLKIKRYEHISGGSRAGFFTWQVRLFRKKGLEWLGLIHDAPRIYGKLKKLSPRFGHIDHYSAPVKEYEEMDVFETRGTAFLIMRDLFIDANIGKMKGIGDLKKIINRNISLKEKRTEEARQIGRIIRKQGLIKYLALDKDHTVEVLNKKYAKSKQGVGLLTKLLYDRYNNKYP